MRSSHVEAIKAQTAADTAEAIQKIEERLTAIEKLLHDDSAAPSKRAKKSDAEQAVPPQPDKA